jgi:hypothetical protein
MRVRDRREPVTAAHSEPAAPATGHGFRWLSHESQHRHVRAAYALLREQLQHPRQLQLLVLDPHTDLFGARHQRVPTRRSPGARCKNPCRSISSAIIACSS